MFDRIAKAIQNLTGSKRSEPRSELEPAAPPPASTDQAPQPQTAARTDASPQTTIDIGKVSPKVLMIVHNPSITSEGAKRLTEVFSWHDPEKLAAGYIDDLRKCSGGYLNYEIVERVDADWYPKKLDGFTYTEESYLTAWREKKPHDPDAIDYPAQFKRFELDKRHDKGDFDEIWFFSFPFAGDYESTMAGPGAFWCNSPPVPGTDHCQRKFVVMGFSYERGVDCMLENFGHRTESIMKRVYENAGSAKNMWSQFAKYDKVAPGEANVGMMHFAPNSQKDYDWGNKTPVSSFCDDWLTYPELQGRSQTVTCADWGNGDMRAHHIWWFNRLPKAPGETDGISNNWWQYVVDPNLV